MKSPSLRIAAGVMAPALGLALIHAQALASQNRYLELGLVRASLRVTAESLGVGLAAGLLAAVLAALPLLRLLYRAAAGLLRRLPGVLAGLLVAAAAGAVLWGAGSRVAGTGLARVLADSYGTAGALGILSAAPVMGAGLALLAFRRPGVARLLAAVVILCAALWGASLAAVSLTAAQPGPGRPPVILISLDTLRADRTGIHGYPRPTTPELRAFAADAVVFDNAIASSPWTLPSHGSMLSGLHPHRHGAVSPDRRLGEEVTTLAEVLYERGYATAAFTGGGYVSSKFGLAQGFVTFTALRDEPTSAIVGRALGWLDGRRDDRPFFLFVHTYEPHTPYMDGRLADRGGAGRVGEAFDGEDLEALRDGSLDPTPAERRYISDLYDGDIAATDAALGELLDGLRERNLLDRSLVVVTSDHGEEMFERTVRRSAAHGHSLYEELIHVPLVIRHPPALAGGRRAEAPAGLVDIAPTVAGALEIPWPVPPDGLDLRRLVPAAGETPREVVLSEAMRSGIPRRSLRGQRYKYITPRDRELADPELYDLSADPGERVNLAPSMAELAGRFEELAGAYAAARKAGSEAVIDEELRDQLRALGYVD